MLDTISNKTAQTNPRINNNGTVNYADGNLTTVAVTDGENASKVQINVTQGSLSVDNNGTVSAPTAGVATAGDVANAINNAKTRPRWRQAATRTLIKQLRQRNHLHRQRR